MTALAAAFHAEMQKSDTLLRPGTRIDPPRIQALLEHVLQGVLRDRPQPFRIGSLAELESIGYGFAPAEVRGGRELYADNVGINLDEVTLRRARNVQWQLVLYGQRWV